MNTSQHIRTFRAVDRDAQLYIVTESQEMIHIHGYSGNLSTQRVPGLKRVHVQMPSGAVAIANRIDSGVYEIVGTDIQLKEI